MKWGATGVALVLVLAAGGVAFGVYWAGREGESGIEAWAGQWLREAVSDRLNARLDFAELDYQYPLTLIVTDVRLVADDERTPGEELELVGMARAELILGEVPREGRPLIVERVHADRPRSWPSATRSTRGSSASTTSSPRPATRPPTTASAGTRRSKSLRTSCPTGRPRRSTASRCSRSSSCATSRSTRCR